MYLVVALVLGLLSLRGRARTIALALAIAIAAPWSIRNAIAFLRFVPLTTNGGLNLATGNLTRYQAIAKATINEFNLDGVKYQICS